MVRLSSLGQVKGSVYIYSSIVQTNLQGSNELLTKSTCSCFQYQVFVFFGCIPVCQQWDIYMTQDRTEVGLPGRNHFSKELKTPVPSYSI